jgi:hypothetical protein
MKSKVISILFLFLALSAKCQTPFFKSYGYGERGYTGSSCNYRNSDGTYTMAGFVDIGPNFNDYRGLNLVKINGAGDVIREKNIFGNMNGISRDFLKPTIDNGCILAIDKKIIKLDSLFNLEWSKNYDYTINSIWYDYMVQHTQDSGYVISTAPFDTSNSTYDNILVKLNKNGLIQWSSKYENPDLNAAPHITAVNKLMSNGGFITCANNSSVEILKRNNIGQIEWGIYIESIKIFDLVEVPNGDIILTGVKLNQAFSNNDLILMKISGAGTLIWSKIYRGNSQVTGEQIELTNNGELIISGLVTKPEDFQSNNVFCMKTDSLGNIIWSKVYGTLNNLSYVSGFISLSKTDDNGVFISYVNCELPNYIGITLNAIKTDEQGNITCSNYQSNLLLNTIDTSYAINNLSLNSSTIPISTSNNNLLDIFNSFNVVYDCTVMGFSSLGQLSKIELFPNPTKGKFSFSSATNQKINQFEIYNALGELIQTSSNANNTEFSDFDISQYPNGIYLIKIYGENNSFSSRLIKQ